MNGIEAVFITLGISLDIFGAVACQGALVAKIEKKHVFLACIIVSLLQVGALYVGNLASMILLQMDHIKGALLIGKMIAAIIFIGLGIRLCYKAWKNEYILERRENAVTVKKFAKIAGLTSAYTLLTGIAFGFLTTNLWLILLLMIGFTVAVVIAGLYIGYHFGYHPKTKAFLVGGLLLVIGGVDVIVRYVN